MTKHDPQEESETQFHYPAGKFDDEVVEASPCLLYTSDAADE